MATDTQVLVVGAGPVGLFMAAELNRHGVSCRIVDKNDGPTHDSRAASIQARTLEILEAISLADEFVQVGNICHAAATYTSDHQLIKYLTFDELDSAFPFVLQLPQSQTERLGRVDGFDQDEAESKRDERAVILRVFSHRSAMRLNRLSFPTPCSIRARPL